MIKKGLALIAMSVLLTSCGGSSTPASSSGSSSGGSSGSGTTITGTVDAPGGSLAFKQGPGFMKWFASLFVEESYAQATGVARVSGINILAFQINEEGAVQTSTSRPTGVISSTTTSSSGAFSITLPAGVSLGPDIIIQATPTTTPRPILRSTDSTTANQNYINCPAVGTTLALNPAAEVATRTLIDSVRTDTTVNPNRRRLSDLTRESASTFISFVQTQVRDDTTVAVTNIGTTIANIRKAINGGSDGGDGKTDTLIQLAQGVRDSKSTSQTVLDGTYNFLGYFAKAGSDGQVSRGIEKATVTLNGTARTFSVSGAASIFRTKEACSSSCTRTFATESVSESTSASGTFFRNANNQVFFTASSGETIVGTTNQTGTLVILPFFNPADNELGFGVAVKQGSGLSSATAAGNTFNDLNLSTIVGGTTGTGSWSGPLSTAIKTGTVSFTSSTMSGSETGSRMSQSLTCTSSASGCNLSATVGSTSGSTTFSGPFTISSNGSFTFQCTGCSNTANGIVSSDGNVAIVQSGDTTNGVEYILAAKQGAGLSNASLNGTYNVLIFGDSFSSTGSITTILQKGVATFDGNGNQTITRDGLTMTRSESCSAGGCSFTVTKQPIPPTTVTSTYSVSSNGSFTLTCQSVSTTQQGGSTSCGNQPTVTGVTSSDGSFNMLRGVGDFTGASVRTIALAVKRS
jgi:hypothetical protein